MNADQSFLDKIRNFFGLSLSTDAGQPNAPERTGVTLVTKQKPIYPGDKASWKDSYNYKKSMSEYEPDNWISGYRHDPKTKDGLETMKFYAEKENMDKFLEALKVAKNLGVDNITPEDLTAMFLQEGRSDFGYNGFNPVNAPKPALEVYDRLKKAGYSELIAGFPALIKEKALAAQRKGIPFYRAWNGTGVNDYGQTGEDYRKKVEKTKEIVKHPKNKDLYEYIRNRLTPEQRAELESLDYNDPFEDSIA